MSLSNKVAIVTGASSGIGATTAIALAREGANVALVARNEAKLTEVAKKCEQHGSKHLVIKADLSKDEDVKTVVKKTVDHFGQLDILVNNAGIGKSIPILDENIMEAFDLLMRTNIRAVVLLTHLAAPHLVKTKGNIINMSSIAGLAPIGSGLIPYGCSKAAVDHFTRCVALELAEHGVRVNNINPGSVRTDLLANAGFPDPDAAWEFFRAATPLQKIAVPEEIADLVVYVASDKARSITGSNFVCDNGALLK